MTAKSKRGQKVTRPRDPPGAFFGGARAAAAQFTGASRQCPRSRAVFTARAPARRCRDSGVVTEGGGCLVSLFFFFSSLSAISHAPSPPSLSLSSPHARHHRQKPTAHLRQGPALAARPPRDGRYVCSSFVDFLLRDSFSPPAASRARRTISAVPSLSLFSTASNAAAGLPSLPTPAPLLGASTLPLPLPIHSPRPLKSPQNNTKQHENNQSLHRKKPTHRPQDLVQRRPPPVWRRRLRRGPAVGARARQVRDHGQGRRPDGQGLLLPEARQPGAPRGLRQV